MKSTVENLERNAPARALTGPISRGDLATTREHLAAMDRNDLNDAAAVYSLLGKRAVSLLRADDVAVKRLEQITKLFESRRVRPS